MNATWQSFCNDVMMLDVYWGYSTDIISVGYGRYWCNGRYGVVGVIGVIDVFEVIDLDVMAL